MMMQQVLIGTALMILTTFVHSGFTIGVLFSLRRLPLEFAGNRVHWMRASLVACLVLTMFLAALIEVALWAATYLWLDAIDGLEKAVYFSMVTFTTLGYGDIVLSERWRLLASFEAANGIILFGWTTALIFAVVQRIARSATRDG
jgi:voltage-gated potassium channel Kch